MKSRLLTGVPVTYLLFLDKKLVDMLTFVRKLPVLADEHEWEFDHPLLGAGYGSWSCKRCGSKRWAGKKPGSDWLGWEGLTCNDLVVRSIMKT